jgi:hypothetical protein
MILPKILSHLRAPRLKLAIGVSASLFNHGNSLRVALFEEAGSDIHDEKLEF